MEDLTNIWNAEDELNEEQLLDYIKGKSGKEIMHGIEKQMAGSSFVNDGVEGLQQFSSTQKINAYVQQLNEDMHRKLHNKQSKKRKEITMLSWQMVALISVIILCVLGYVIIAMLRK